MKQAATTKVLAILPRAAARATQWRPVLLLVLLGWIPTALLAVPLWRTLAENLDNSVHSAQWAQSMDVIMFADLITRVGLSGSALAGAGIAAVAVLLLLLPFQHAVLVTAARTDERIGLGELLRAGLREYGPMLRMLLVSLIPLGVALGLASLAFKWLGKYAQHAIVESDVDPVAWAVYALAGLLVVYALAGIEAGRARFALDPRKRSAFKAWWRGFKLMFFSPLRGLGIFLGITIPALIAVAALALARVEIATAGVPGFAIAWVIVQVLAAVLVWANFARLAAYYELTRALHDADMAVPPPRSVAPPMPTAPPASAARSDPPPALPSTS